MPDTTGLPDDVPFPDTPPAPSAAAGDLLSEESVGQWSPAPPSRGHGGSGGHDQGISAVDVGAELRLLAALFADPQLIDELSEKVAGPDFSMPAHEAIFEACLACDASGIPLDVITVADELSRRGDIARAGGVEGVRRVASAGESNHDLAVAAVADAVANFDAYAHIVYDRATRRRLMQAGRQIVTEAASGQMEAEDLVQAAEERVFAVAQDRSESTMKTMAQVAADVADRMAKARSKKLIGVSTGFEKLDEITAGFQPGQMITIAARPAMGKSVALMQLCRHIAETTGDLVPVFSYEMQSGEIGLRLLAASSGVPLNELQRGFVPPEMERVVAQESAKMAESTLMIDDQPPQSINGIRSELRRISRRGKIAAVGLDYIQLIGGSRTRANTQASRENEVAEVSRTIKLMADEFQVPMLACAQLNRGLEQRPNKRPLLSDIRESGTLEQDSSMVIFIHRPHVYDPSVPETEAEWIVAKNRNGACLTIYADWEGPQQRFRPSDRTGSAGEVVGVGPGGFGGAAGGRAFGDGLTPPPAPPVNSHGADGSSHTGPSAGKPNLF